MHTNNKITFNVANVVFDNKYPPEDIKLADYLQKKYKDNIIVKTSDPGNLIKPDLGNGFVGSAIRAYNYHHHLVIGPDDVWIAIMVALAHEIDRHPEEMRHLFVNHEGQKEIVVSGGGNIYTANYEKLVGQIADKISENTKDHIKEWVECNFSTTTNHIRTISRIVLMGAMKNFFSYKMSLCCGLPRVTIRGTLEDWTEIRKRVNLLATWNIESLTKWSEILGMVLDRFVHAFNRKIDVDFWNGIAYHTGGGSGPSYLQGWILAFIPFDDQGKYSLYDISAIKESGEYGMMDTNDIPASAIEVPVIIDDNGRTYDTRFYAGAIASQKIDNETIAPSLDWALIDVTK